MSNFEIEGYDIKVTPQGKTLTYHRLTLGTLKIIRRGSVATFWIKKGWQQKEPVCLVFEVPPFVPYSEFYKYIKVGDLSIWIYQNFGYDGVLIWVAKKSGDTHKRVASFIVGSGHREDVFAFLYR